MVIIVALIINAILFGVNLIFRYKINKQLKHRIEILEKTIGLLTSRTIEYNGTSKPKEVFHDAIKVLNKN